MITETLKIQVIPKLDILCLYNIFGEEINDLFTNYWRILI